MDASPKLFGAVEFSKRCCYASEIKKIFEAIRNPRLLVVFFLAFSSGLPLLLIGSTLKVWLAELNVDLSTIGVFSMVGLPYTLKFVWSPVIDRYRLFGLGRRRDWLLLTQAGLVATLVGLSFAGGSTLISVAIFGVLVAIVSASQDTVVDAYRVEVLSPEEQGLGASVYVVGYRFGMFAAGAGAFFLADHISWRETYWVMAALMGVGMVTTWFCSEPVTKFEPPRSLRESVIGPAKDLLRRDRILWILVFVLLYKVGEQMASEMYPVFFRKIGFSKTEIAMASKTVAVFAMMAGGIIGGLLLVRLPLRRALFLFGVFQGVAILLFTFLAIVGPKLLWLATAVGVENFASGMATTAYMAYMAAQTNRQFTATQYAVFASLTGVPRVFFNSSTGFLAVHLGWELYFVFCTLLNIPGLLMIVFGTGLFEVPKGPKGSSPKQ